MLSSLVILPLIGSLAVIGVSNPKQVKLIGIAVSLAVFWNSLYLYAEFDQGVAGYQNHSLAGIIAVDGISLPFIILTGFLTPIVLLASWTNVTKHIQWFVAGQLLIESLLILVWVVTDLISFYVAFEAVLIPLFVTVGVWGAASRIRSAFLLFMFTLSGSLLILISIIIVYLNVGTGSFDLVITLDFNTQAWVWVGIFIAFAIKTPIIPFHMWLPRAHADAPLAASMVLAGTVLKMATYGYIRLCLGIMPVITEWFIPAVQIVAVISLVYSSLATIRQSDIKALIAYSSIGHIAVVILALFSNSLIGIIGGVTLSIAHGFTSPALFILTGGVLYDRYHTRVIYYYRGLAQYIPLFTTLFLVFTVANIGQPLTLNWLGEFTSLIGVFSSSVFICVVASTVQVLSASYAIWVYVRITSGSVSPYLTVSRTISIATGDVNRREFICLIYLLVPVLFFGIYASPLTNIVSFSLSILII